MPQSSGIYSRARVSVILLAWISSFATINAFSTGMTATTNAIIPTRFRIDSLGRALQSRLPNRSAQERQQPLLGSVSNHEANSDNLVVSSSASLTWLQKYFPSVSWEKLPNYLTYARCAAIPALVGVFYLPNQNIATALLFGMAAFTDWLDGYLARQWNVASDFGAFLDPVADKMMVSTSLILLSGRYGAVVALPTSIILARELAVSALREWMAQRGQRDAVKVGFQGKVKTALTMLSLCILLLVPGDRAGLLGHLYGPALLLLYLCAGITVTSGSVYFRAAGPVLMGK